MAKDNDEKLAKLEAKFAHTEADLARLERENAALRAAVEHKVEHGITRQALANKEKRAALKAAARKEKGCALFVVRGDPFYDGEKLHPDGSVVRLPLDQDPSINWSPVTAKLPNGEYVSGDDVDLEDEGDADAEQVARAKGPAGAPKPTTGPSAPAPAANPVRPSDTKVA